MKHKKITGRITAAALSAVLGLTGAGLFPAMETLASYNKVNGYYQLADGTVIRNAIARGIDVSRWQGNINWAAVAADDVDFVMLGTRSKGLVDPYFHANVKGASDAGIKVGAYIYSLATTPEMAIQEADFVLDLVKEYPISFPIAFDAEDSGTLGTLSPAEVTEITNAFCKRIEDAGYYAIDYANDHWLANKIDLSNMKYDVWVARYGVEHNYSDPIMWQVTSTGSINGITGNVDIDFLYRDLTPKLPGNLWRTIGENTYYYQNYKMQKDNWIDDGNGWYYMDSQGLASKGWLEKAGVHYYLEEKDGRMVTGWNQLSDKWYFFNNSGAMNTGWLDDNGARYYLNNDGAMVTGWHTDNDKKYFLTGSGAAATGWRSMDNTWYYFNQTYDMAKGWISPDGSWYYLNNDGKMQNGWLEEGNAKYYLSNSSGKMTTGWRQVDNFWYYFNGSGGMVTGLTDVNGQLYYLNPSDGKMVASTTMTIDGVDYSIDGNGVCTKVEAPVDNAESGDGSQTAPSQESPGDNAQPSAPAETEAQKPTGEIGPGIH